MGLLTVRTWFWRPLVSRVFCSYVVNRGNCAPELPLPRTHFVTGGGTLQRFPTWQRLGSHSQSCAGATPASDTFRDQRRHSPTHPYLTTSRQTISTLLRRQVWSFDGPTFGDVHPVRGDGQSPVTFKRRAEISSHTRKMCSSTAPQGMQGVSFFAETEERKQKPIIFPEIAWRHTHQTLCRLAFTTEIPKQTDQWTVCDRDLLSDSFSRSCLDETEIQQNSITQVHTVTKPEPQHFVAAKHTMKTDQDAKRDVQTPLYARKACNTTDHRWRNWRYTPGHLVSSSDFQYFPRVWNTSTQLRDEMIQNTQCAFSLSKTISSRPQLFHVFWKFLIQAPNFTGQDFAKNVHTKKCLLQAISSPSKWRGSDKSV